MFPWCLLLVLKRLVKKLDLEEEKMIQNLFVFVSI